MEEINLTKTAVEAAYPQAQAVELPDTLAPGSRCKITPAGTPVVAARCRMNDGRGAPCPGASERQSMIRCLGEKGCPAKQRSPGPERPSSLP